MAYRTTPHSSTGVPPSSLMFRYEMRTKLPCFRPDPDIGNEHVRDKDKESKLEGKRYADERRNATATGITEGDKVLIKNYDQGKLEPSFKPEPYEVVQREANEVIVRKDDVEYRRNVSHTKPVMQSCNSDVNDHVNVNENVHAGVQEIVNENVSNSKATSEVSERPKRNAKLPTKFEDFVMK